MIEESMTSSFFRSVSQKQCSALSFVHRTIDSDPFQLPKVLRGQEEWLQR